jgi:hypothetical protein
MRVYFETDIYGQEVTIGATAADVNEYSEALDLRIRVILQDGRSFPLYKYVDDPDEIERITQACLDELYGNKYEGGLYLE